MKNFIIFSAFLIFFGISSNSHAGLTGIKTIPGTYSSISDAITVLNDSGVGAGGVIFNVAAGFTETASNLVIQITTELPTASNTVVFQKSGVGANPLITAAAGTSASFDGIIKFSGADYITFDGIDLLDPVSNTGNAMMEWGYALMRKDSLDGSTNNVIKNCSITLQKSNVLSIGIYIINRNTAGTVVTATVPEGQNSRNMIYGNNLSNIYRGINVIASSTTRDSDNEIGMNGQTSNSITNWGGSTSTCDGIRCEGQNNIKINNNIINGGAGTSGSGVVFGIIATLFGSLPAAQNYEISYNQITISTNATSQATYAIRALANGDTVRIHHNTVENCNSVHTTNAFNGIVHDPVGSVNAVYIYNNIVRNNTHSGTGAATLLAGAGTGTIANLLIRSNQVYGNQKTGISGTMNCIQAANSSLVCDSNQVYNNSMPNTSGTGSSFIYGYINSGDPVSEKVSNNSFYNLTTGGSNSSASSLITGIRSNAAATTVKEFNNNLIYGLSSVSGSTANGGVFGIYSSLSLSAKIHSNIIYNISNSGTTGSSGGCWVSSGSGIEIYNNFISDIKTPNSTNANGVIGISSTSTTANSTIGIYYNSIYLTAAGGSTFGSSGISVTTSTIATTAALDMRNNIIINLSTPGSTSGFTVAYRRSSSNLANYASVSDFNNFYAGSPSANRLIYYDVTNSDQTLPAYQTRVAPRDANSKSVTVSFVNPATGDLHLTGGSAGDINLSGTPVAGIILDIDGAPRNVTYPYKGADESTALVTFVLNLTANLEACSPMADTIKATLRSSVSPYSVLEEKTSVLSAGGTASFNFTKAVNGVSYYIVINHRNSIETWSKAGGEVFAGGTLNYDFTSSAAQAYDNNEVLVGSKYSVYTGDVNQDGIVDLTDLVAIYNDGSNFVTGYVLTDLNCNSIVDLTDLLFAYNNSSIFVSIKRP